MRRCTKDLRATSWLFVSATSTGVHGKLTLLSHSQAEAWVTKGLYIQRMDPKGRGRIGRKHHPSARMSVVLKEGKTHAEILEKERKYKLGRIVGAGLVREDVPIRNPGPGWAW